MSYPKFEPPIQTPKDLDDLTQQPQVTKFLAYTEGMMYPAAKSHLTYPFPPVVIDMSNVTPRMIYKNLDWEAPHAVIDRDP